MDILSALCCNILSLVLLMSVNVIWRYCVPVVLFASLFTCLCAVDHRHTLASKSRIWSTPTRFAVTRLRHVTHWKAHLCWLAAADQSCQPRYGRCT